MASHESIFKAVQRARWLRPDAYRWIRPDAARFLVPGTDPASVFPALQRKFSPDQPRVPAGNPDGGQWTDGGGGINDPRVLSDADPEGLRPYEQYAQNLPDKRPIDLRRRKREAATPCAGMSEKRMKNCWRARRLIVVRRSHSAMRAGLTDLSPPWKVQTISSTGHLSRIGIGSRRWRMDG